MLYSIKKLIGKNIHASDETFGSCKDFLFDDQTHRIVYLVIDTGNWLPGRKVLIHPQHIADLESSDLDSGIPIDLTRERIENSPPIDSDQPVSRQAEAKLHDYYGWIPYWLAKPGNLTNALSPAGTIASAGGIEAAQLDQSSGYENPNLRSAKEVSGYLIRPADQDSSGPLSDLLLESATWTIKHLILDTRPWFVGGQRALPFKSAKYIDYNAAEIGVNLTAEQIKEAPSSPCEKEPVPFKDKIALEKGDP